MAVPKRVLSPPKRELLDSCEKGWTYSEEDADGVIDKTQGATDWFTEGEGSIKIDDCGNNPGEYGLFEKDFDLTAKDSLKVDVHADGSAVAGDSYHQILIAGNVEWQDDPGDTYEKTVEIDVTGYSGINTIGLRNKARNVAAPDGGRCWWDNIRGYPEVLSPKRILTPKR